jgi:HK97 family phage major capsid protein
MKEAIVLRKVAGVLTACYQRAGMTIGTPAANVPPLSSLAFALCLMLVPLIAVLALVAFAVPDAAGLALASLPVSALPRKTQADLDSVIKHAEKMAADYAGKEMPEDVATKYNDLMKEGAALSEKVNAEMQNAKTMERMKAAQAYLGEVPNPTLPGADTKSEEVAGYITPGHLAVLSEEYTRCIKGDGSFAKNGMASIDIKGALLGTKSNPSGLIALTDTQIKALRGVTEQMKSHRGFETKDLPVFGEYVIAPQRVDRFVQDTRPEVLTLRDVLTVSPTTSNLIQYVAEVAFDNDADIQSEGTTAATTAAKPESDVEYELREASIKTIAHTLPVSEQQLADAPSLINRINTRLMHGVKQKEEQLMGYGTGSGLEFAGFFDTDSDVDAVTTSADTLIDKIREGVTEIMVSAYSPTFVWVNPADWETIELTKGSDGHYVWAIIRDVLGPRIWSMRVVQGTGTKKAGATTTNLLIGDPMGAVIYDRQQANIAIGWVDDQFVKNLRTIRAEERMTLVIDAPAAFRKIETAS